MNKRLVIIEFENVDKATAAYESSEYQAALALLKNQPSEMCGSYKLGPNEPVFRAKL